MEIVPGNNDSAQPSNAVEAGLFLYNPYKQDTAFGIVPDRLLSSKLSKRALVLYAKLRHHAGRNGKCWPTRKTLARGLGWSTRTVDRAIQDLVKAKVIVRLQETFWKTITMFPHPSEYAYKLSSDVTHFRSFNKTDEGEGAELTSVSNLTGGVATSDVCPSPEMANIKRLRLKGSGKGKVIPRELGAAQSRATPEDHAKDEHTGPEEASGEGGGDVGALPPDIAQIVAEKEHEYSDLYPGMDISQPDVRYLLNEALGTVFAYWRAGMGPEEHLLVDPAGQLTGKTGEFIRRHMNARTIGELTDHLFSLYPKKTRHEDTKMALDRWLRHATLGEIVDVQCTTRVHEWVVRRFRPYADIWQFVQGSFTWFVKQGWRAEHHRDTLRMFRDKSLNQLLDTQWDETLSYCNAIGKEWEDRFSARADTHSGSRVPSSA